MQKIKNIVNQIEREKETMKKVKVDAETFKKVQAEITNEQHKELRKNLSVEYFALGLGTN